MRMGPVPDGDWNELFKEERPKHNISVIVEMVSGPVSFSGTIG